ncbi:MAG: cytochrome c oxidase subunit 3 family protein [Opitutales bacterium]
MSETLPAHQFDDIEQQREADSLGMWTFLATEVMFFGGLFLAYILYRGAYPDVFAAAGHHMNVVAGAINTGVLLCSSLTMALAVHAAQAGRRKLLVGLLSGTWILGLLFLGIKAYEYHGKFTEQLVPGAAFHYEGAPENLAELFFLLYFAMTGLHGLHVAIGIGVLLFLTARAWRNKISREKFMPVEIVGLYWHFVDIVWVFLFPLFYLINRT